MSRGVIHWRYTPRRAICGVDIGDDTTNRGVDDRDVVTCKRCRKSIARWGG